MDAYANLKPATLYGWPRLQARMVDQIKRAALRRLHASTAGEVLLLRMYLAGEQATELALQQELMPADQPEWLAKQVTQHLSEEKQHVLLFADAMTQRGVALKKNPPDWLSRRKIVRWKRLAQAYSIHFQFGTLVPTYAIGLCAEQMAGRVLRRHCDTIGTHHAMHKLLASVLSDEDKHVRLCEHTLKRIVSQDELPYLNKLLVEVRNIERGFGISGAIGIYLAGVFCLLKT